MTNRALIALLRAKGRRNRFDKRMLSYNHVPNDINDHVRQFIARGYGAGLVPTFTTNGQHSAGSFHKMKPGAAADLGLRKELIGTRKGHDRMVKFQRAELKAFRAGRRDHMKELLGPDNRAAVLKGAETDLTEGTALEQQHDNHVHGAFVPSTAAKAKPAVAKPKKRKRPPPSVMYDSVTVGDIPRTADAVAGYVGGRFPTFALFRHWAAFKLRYPNARRRQSIAVASRFNADILDVEPGDATPAVAAGWIKRQLARKKNKVPGVYTSVAGAQALINLLAQEGVPRSSYRLWTAHYTFRPHICDSTCGFGFRDRADATQWTDRAHGLNLDQSKCRASFWRSR